MKARSHLILWWYEVRLLISYYHSSFSVYSSPSSTLSSQNMNLMITLLCPLWSGEWRFLSSALNHVVPSFLNV